MKIAIFENANTMHECFRFANLYSVSIRGSRLDVSKKYLIVVIVIDSALDGPFKVRPNRGVLVKNEVRQVKNKTTVSIGFDNRGIVLPADSFGGPCVPPSPKTHCTWLRRNAIVLVNHFRSSSICRLLQYLAMLLSPLAA